MIGIDDDIWFPDDARIARAQVTALGTRLGLSDYDALYRFSVAHPDRYWKAVNDFTGIKWMTKPTGYVDFGRGREFPDWFPGGRLNWVDTVLVHAENPETRTSIAIASEPETGATVSLTYQELADRVRRVAAGLRAMGLRRGDRIGLICETGIEANLSVLAISYIGCVAVPLFSGFGCDAIVARLQSSGARALIATTGFHRRGRLIDMRPVIGEALTRLETIEHVIWKGDGAPDGPQVVSWRDLVATAPTAHRAEPMSPDDAFMLIYTSGTTGQPKGIVHTHGGFPLKVVHDGMIHWDIGAGDVFLWPVDMGWIAGPISLCAVLMRGATLICYSGAPDFPDWSRMSTMIERHGVTHFGAAPTTIRGLAASAEIATRGERTSVRILIVAGEGIDAVHFNWFRHAFGPSGAPVINSSGGTEASGVLLCSVVVKPIWPASFNTASPGAEICVVDPEGRTIVGAPGELAIRAPFVGMTRSLWQNDALYLQTYWEKQPGTWLHGDLALQLENGSFMLLGRADDTLKIAGKRLGAAEVEEIVLGLEQVREAAAVGVDDQLKGQRLAIFVVGHVKDDRDTAKLADVVTRAVETRLGKAFRPSDVYIVGQLPKTRTSKIMRRLIRQICCGAPLGDLSPLDNPAALDAIRAAIGDRRQTVAALPDFTQDQPMRGSEK